MKRTSLERGERIDYRGFVIERYAASGLYALHLDFYGIVRYGTLQQATARADQELQ